MLKLRITDKSISKFKNHLIENEKSKATVEKYIHEVKELSKFACGKDISKTVLIQYRQKLQETNMATTVNCKISAINTYLDFMNFTTLKIKLLKVQRRAFIEDGKELTEQEYKRLLSAAKIKKNDRLYYIMVTICATGIRISELPFITIEAAKSGRVEISLKGKTRTVLLQKELSEKLKKYAKLKKIDKGSIFVTSSGKPIDRSNICHDMKKICEAANVSNGKVFPHNLRHLFARSFYRIEKNLSNLADILGHSSIETTRIYVAASFDEYERMMRKMKLIL